jgi:ADP-ribose pyrophosphatase YjhB (NUDIX family)
LGHFVTLSTRLAETADRLRDAAAFGLHYAQDSYDRERYRATQDMAIELFAIATDRPAEAFEPLRGELRSRPTTLSVGDVAVIDDDGRILLMQRADNQLWAMPGGALEVGETPAAGVEREAYEETGVRSRATVLVSIYDSRLCGSLSAFQLYHLLFLCQPLDTSKFGKGSHRHEALDVRWSMLEELPLERIDPGHRQRIAEALRVWRDDTQAYFDRTPTKGSPANE